MGPLMPRLVSFKITPRLLPVETPLSPLAWWIVLRVNWKRGEERSVPVVLAGNVRRLRLTAGAPAVAVPFGLSGGSFLVWGASVRLVLCWFAGRDGVVVALGFMRSMPFQLKNGHQNHHHHGAAMEGKPPAPPPQPQQQHPAPPRVSRFRRLLVRVSASEKFAADGKEKTEKDEKPPHGEAEVGSVGLDSMVLSFMEESAAVERPPRGRCNCFNGSNQEESDDEDFDFFLPSEHASATSAVTAGDTLESLKGLVQSTSVVERNLLADASKLAERCGKGFKGKAERRRAVADGLRALGYDAGVCKSQWEKTPTYPAGEHEYVDAVVGTEAVRLIVEMDFRSQFELARSTKAYRAALQALPPLFVGIPERLGKIVAVVAEAARHSLKKKGLHFPPWRKPEYMRAKWLSPHTRCGDKPVLIPPLAAPTPVQAASFSGEFELIFDRKPNSSGGAVAAEDKITVVVSPWRPTEEASNKKTQQQQPKTKVVTGLAAVL